MPVTWAIANFPFRDAEIHPDAAGRRAIDLGDRHHQHHLLLARNVQQIDQVRASLEQLPNRIDGRLLVSQAGNELDAKILPRLHLRPRSVRRVIGDDPQDLRGFDYVLGLAPHHNLLADHIQMHGAIGKRVLDFRFQHLERGLVGFYL